MKKELTKVSCRGGFADRNGIKPENTTMQIYDFDRRTRVAIRNEIIEIIRSTIENNPRPDARTEFWRSVLKNVYAQPIDYEFGMDYNVGYPLVEATIYDDDYASVLTLIEFILNYCIYENDCSDDTKQRISEKINNVLEKEYVGYRYINGIISPITSDIEIESIKEAIDKTPYKKVADHIENSLLT